MISSIKDENSKLLLQRLLKIQDTDLLVGNTFT